MGTLSGEREYLRDLITVTGATVAKFSRIGASGDEFLFSEPAGRIRTMLDDLEASARQLAEAERELDTLREENATLRERLQVAERRAVREGRA